MSPPALLTSHDGGPVDRCDDLVPHVVVVDPRYDTYQPLMASARAGKLTLHLRSSGAEALKLARRLRVDAWLVAPELDDVSGHDFVELLRARLGGSKLAMVETADVDSARWRQTHREGAESGAEATLSPPITFRDLERLLGVPAEERGALFTEASPAARPFVMLPIAASAAAVAVALLMLG